MRRFIVVALVAVLTLTIQAIRPQDPPSSSVPHAAAVAVKKSEVHNEASKTPKRKQTASNREKKPVSKPTTCREAIAAVWPANLQSGAITVLTNENRSESPSAKGAVNNDEHGSRDYGCFQINDYWHPDYFKHGDWRDPVWAAKYALGIYNGRQAQTGNGWEAWYAVQGILW